MIPANLRKLQVNKAALPAISHTPVTSTTNSGCGTQPGTIGRKNSGERRCVTPANT